VKDRHEHAARMCDPKPEEALLMLGLYLSTNFGVFSGYSSDAARPHTPTWFRFHERIVTIDPAQVWDEYVRVCDSPKSVTPPVFDFEPADLAPATVKRRGAVQPPGEYAYHAEIKRVSERLWQEGDFRQAVLDAFIHVIATVKERTALKNPNGMPYDGDDLMNRAFCPDNRVPPCTVQPVAHGCRQRRAARDWNLFRGVVGLRHFKAHIVSEFDDPHRAHEYLALASLLMRLLDLASYAGAAYQQSPPPAVGA
jgi:hypothetical protein